MYLFCLCLASMKARKEEKGVEWLCWLLVLTFFSKGVYRSVFQIRAWQRDKIMGYKVSKMGNEEEKQRTNEKIQSEWL